MLPDPRISVRYRWVIVVAGICGLFASLGIGRFSLAMLLPAMAASLELSYAQMGLIGTVNFCGYLGAVLFCGTMMRLLGARVLVTMALLLVGLSMLAIGFAEHLLVIILLYFATGVGSAMSNIPIMALISAWFEPELRGRAMGLVVIGNGLGIVMAGHLVPVLNVTRYGWRFSWIVLGALALGAAALCWLMIRNAPAGLSHRQGQLKNRRPGSGIITEAERSRVYLRCAALYFLFGFTYVIYITFFVTTLVQERGFSEQGAGILWSWVGLLSLGSGPLFGYLSDRWGRKSALMLVFALQAAAYILATRFVPQQLLYLSIFCFGIVAWSVPSIIAALIGDYSPAEKTASVFGFVTFIFGIGQIAGPFCAGWLAQKTFGFTASFLLAALLAGAAVFLAAGLPGRDGRQGNEKKACFHQR